VKQENEKAKTVDNLQKELDELKSKPTGTILTAEQEQKLNDYDKLRKWADKQELAIK